MATRQEMMCALDLIRKTCQVNGWFDNTIKILDSTIILKDEEEKPLNFGQVKVSVEKSRKGIETLTANIKMVLAEVNPTFLDSGIAEISSLVAKEQTYYTRNDIDSDASSINSAMVQAETPLSLVTSAESLENIADDFKLISLKTGIAKPDQRMIFPAEMNHANILHDILDALSYELQGLSSYTGQPHLLRAEQLNKLVNRRITAAYVHLPLVSGEDQQNLGTILNYVGVNIQGKDLKQLAEVGRYIDRHLPKLILVRRSWCLEVVNGY